MIAREAAVPGAMSGGPGKTRRAFRQEHGRSERRTGAPHNLLPDRHVGKAAVINSGAFSAGFQSSDNCTPAPPGGTKRSSRR